MRAVLQRVKSASVGVRNASGGFDISGRIGCGLLAFVAVENGDTQEDAEWIASKIAALRVFEDDEGKMNLSALDAGADVLLVSQFTLLGNLRKGSRPSFNRSAPAEFSKGFFESFKNRLEAALSKSVPTGVFGAEMEVSLINDGPVTIIIDSRNRDI